jgi:2,4-dienoyl-CoA reductase (NADPH2)
VLVVGGGPAGLEAARVAAGAGLTVRLTERSATAGGTLRAAATGPARERMATLADWLEGEARRLGVRFDLETEVTADDLDAAAAAGTQVILATGSRPVARFDPAVSMDALAVLSGAARPAGAAAQSATRDAGPPDPAARPAGQAAGSAGEAGGAAADPVVQPVGEATGPADLDAGRVVLPAGPVLVYDPVGGPAGVAVAELLAAAGRKVSLVTQDPVVGTLLSLTGDLADSNVRLQRAGVTRELRSLLREVSGGTALLEDVWTGVQRRVACAVLVDCGHRLPDETLYLARPGTPRAGDCVAPRTVAEAIREGRRLGLAAAGLPSPADEFRELREPRPAAGQAAGR